MLWGKKHNLTYFAANSLKQVAPEERYAVNLLTRSLPDYHVRQYLNTGTLDVVGHITGNIYQLVREEKTLQINGFDADYSYCLHGHNLPPTDNVLGWWFMLRYNESKFLELANRRKIEYKHGARGVMDRRRQAYHNITGDVREHVLRRAKIRLQRYRRNKQRQNYWYSPTNLLNHYTENISPPITCREDHQYITRGIASCCLKIHNVNKEVSTIDRKCVKSIYWSSMRSFDNTFLFMLMSEYAQARHRPKKPTSRFAKIIMSSRVFLNIVREDDFELFRHGTPLQMNCLQVLIDDRVQNNIFKIANASHLGVITVFDKKLGIGVLAPENIMAYHYYDGRVYPASEEYAVDTVYGLFIEQDQQTVKYDCENYNLQNSLQSTRNIV